VPVRGRGEPTLQRRWGARRDGDLRSAACSALAGSDAGLQTAFAALAAAPPGPSAAPPVHFLCDDARLWQLLRTGLVRPAPARAVQAPALRQASGAAGAPQVRPDAATRKAAYAALTGALPPGAAGRPPWSAFRALWDLLLQHPLYLIEAPWAEHMARLRALSAGAAACADRCGPPALARGPRRGGPRRQGRARARRAPEPGAALALAWEAVLWRVGFLHDNLQVRPGAGAALGMKRSLTLL